MFMHAACYAHALVPGSLEEAEAALARPGATARETLEALAESAAMVRSNAHADESGAWTAASPRRERASGTGI